MKTKIVATLGPASMDKETMRTMVKNGVRIFRFNFSHANAAAFEQPLSWMRELEQEIGLPLTAMGDLCGPKIRIGEVAGSPLEIQNETRVLLGLPETREEATGTGLPLLPLDMPELLKGLKPGMPVSLSDGQLRFTVSRTLREDQLFELTAQNDGLLTSNKGIFFPGKAHALSALTDKDRIDLCQGLKIGMDAFALSFVQTEQDLQDIIEAMEECSNRVPIIAKIERHNAVENLDRILELADGIMVARGDLGLECPLTEVPVIQKKIISACRHAQKPVIVATQMMLSMVKNIVPTRAEASDVANAIMDGTDCVMLSEETAIGAHPVEVIRTISEIAKSTEPHYFTRNRTPFAPRENTQPGKFMAYAACLLAAEYDSKAVVCHTETGITARFLSTRRAPCTLYALTPRKATLKALNFAWGVQPILCDEKVASRRKRARQFINANDRFTAGENLVLMTHTPTPGQPRKFTNQLELYYK